MPKTLSLEKRLDAIEARNAQVEREKRWETSMFRKVSIAVITYFTLAAYFAFVLKVEPWTNAIVPTVGFLLSTLSLSMVKSVWLRLFNLDIFKSP